jgi:prevent-host-death family protein
MAKFITVTELRNKTAKIVREIRQTRNEIVVTVKGKPVIVIRSAEEEDISTRPGLAEVKKREEDLVKKMDHMGFFKTRNGKK